MTTLVEVYSTQDDLSAIVQPPVFADGLVHNPQIVGNLQRGEHPFGGLRRGKSVTLRDKVMTFAVNLGKKHDVEASLKREVLVNHFANRLGLNLPRVRVCFRVMEKVHHNIIGEQIVDIVDKVAEVKSEIRVFTVPDFLGAVEQGVDHEELAVINDIPLQLGVFEDGRDVLIGCAGLDLVVTLKGKTAFFYGENADLFGLKAFDGAGLARPACSDDENRNSHALTSQATREGLARRFSIGADAVIERMATLTERLVRILAVVCSRIAERLVVARLMMGLVRW